MDKLLEALRHDDIVGLKKILNLDSIDLSQNVAIGSEYDLDEHDEAPLLFFAISIGASLEAIEILVGAGADIKEVNQEGIGALDTAIKHGRLDVVKLCKSLGVDLFSSKRKSGITPLILAASLNDIKIVTYLLNKGADINESDNYGMSAMDYARRMGHKNMLEFLESKQKA